MTSKYWHDRKVQYDQSLARDEKRLYSKLAAYYEREAAQLDKEIAAYYARYGVNGVLSYRNLLETLPDADKELLIEQIDAFVKRYPEYADLVPVRESIYKLNRLEGLRQSIAMQQLHMGAYEQAQALAFFQKQALRYANGAASYLGLGSSFCRIDSDLIQAAVGNRWCSGKDFSERIWDNRAKLADTLHTQVINGVIRGEDYHRLARQLREKFTQVSQKNAERLIFTEDTYLSNEAAMQVFEREAAVTEYEYVCTNDSSSCDICRGLGGQRFRISQRMPGTNSPPMHPWCRCFFDPVVPELGAFRSGKNADTALTSGADGGIIEVEYKRFHTGEEVNDFFYYDSREKRSLLQKRKSTYGRWKSSVTSDQESAISDYCADGYDAVNSFLRKNNGYESISEEYVKSIISDLDSAIGNFDVRENFVTYRGSSIESLLQEFPEAEDFKDLVGRTYHDNAYMSTSPIKKVAEKFATQNGQEGIVLEISVPKGKGLGGYINEFSGFKDDEYEFLLKRGTFLEIYEVDESGNIPILKCRWKD